MVSDEQNIFARLLPHPDDTTFACVRFIDLYGNTVFNRAQAETVLVGLDRLRQTTERYYESMLLDEIAALARRCADEPHLYLKFYGD